MKDWKNWNAGIEEGDEGIWNADREKEREREIYVNTHWNMLTYTEWICSHIYSEYVNIYRGNMLTYKEWIC